LEKRKMPRKRMKKNKRAPYMPQALKDAQKLWKEW